MHTDTRSREDQITRQESRLLTKDSAESQRGRNPMMVDARSDGAPAACRLSSRAPWRSWRTFAAALVLGSLAYAPITHAHAAYAAASAASPVTYTDPQGRYTFSIPQDWNRLQPRHGDVAFGARNGNLSVAVTTGQDHGYTAIDVPETLRRAAQGLGTSDSTARYGHFTAANGGTIGYGFQAFRASGGAVGLVIVAGAAVQGRVVAMYEVDSNVQAASWPDDSKQLAGIMRSLVIARAAATGPSSPPGTGAAATCKALKDQMINFNQLNAFYDGLAQSEYMDGNKLQGDYYATRAEWYKQAIERDYQEAVHLRCFN
jgi:hypothetical protein